MKSVLHWTSSATGVPPLTCAAVGVGLLVAVLYFKLFFGNFRGFGKDVGNSGSDPLLDDDYDYVESQWSSNKILIWLLLSFGCGWLAYHQLPGWFPDLFR